MPISSILLPSNAYKLPTHPQVTVAARESFEYWVDKCASFGNSSATQLAAGVRVAAKCVLGERDPAPAASRAQTQHAKISFDEGAVGSALVAVQKVLAETAAIVGAVAGVIIAGGQSALGASSTGTVAANALRGKNAGALAATLATSVPAVALNWARLAVEAGLQILPPIGTVCGGAVGSAVGSAMSILAGLGHLLNVSQSPATAAPAAPASTPTTQSA